MTIDSFKPSHFKVDTLTNIIGSNPEVLLSLLEELVKGSERTYEQLKENVALGNWKSVKNNAHFLKSNFRYIGCSEVAESLKKIEVDAAFEERRSGIAAVLMQINATFPLVMADLKSFIAHLKQ